MSGSDSPGVAASAARPRIAVAAGCLVDGEGRVLIAQRPEGKIAAGQWEFPGGKIEPGESACAALARELHEELGIAVRAARPLIRVLHDYRERTVELDCWRVDGWDGAPQGRERQALAWVRPEAIGDYPILAADTPVVAALRLPVQYVFTPPRIGEAALLAGLSRLPRGALLRLRLPGLDERAYLALARRVLPAAAGCALRVILDRVPADVGALGAAGWHADSGALRRLRTRPDVPLCLASVHDAADLQRARALGCDAAVLGTVRMSASHPQGATLGFDAAGRLAQRANLPVYWIGGLRPADLPAVHAHYAQGIAAIGAYWGR